MNKVSIFTFSLFLILLCSTAFSAEVDQTNPYTMVQQVANKTFLQIKNQREEIKLNPKIINNIVEKELLPYVDCRFSALKILAKYFRQYPKDKIDKYVEIFKGYSVSVFSKALNYYNDQTIEFEPAKDFADQKYVVVRMRINDEGKSINVSFSVRKDVSSGQWQVYDIIAEGISMLSSLQSEFEPMLRTEGIDAVMKKMTNGGNQQ